MIMEGNNGRFQSDATSPRSGSPQRSSAQHVPREEPPRGHIPAQGAGNIPAAFHSQTVGERGPVLEQDNILHETLETFVHTKIIERPVHVKGSGAFGYFQNVHSMAAYTKLCFLQSPGQQVPVTVRFPSPSAIKAPRILPAMCAVSPPSFTRNKVFLICSAIISPYFPYGMPFVFRSSFKPFCPRR